MLRYDKAQNSIFQMMDFFLLYEKTIFDLSSFGTKVKIVTAIRQLKFSSRGQKKLLQIAEI